MSGCEAKEQRSRRWILGVEKLRGYSKTKGDTVNAEVAKALGSSNETKEFRISCFSQRPKFPVCTGGWQRMLLRICNSIWKVFKMMEVCMEKNQ